MQSGHPADEIEIRPAAAGECDFLSALALRSKAHWGYSTDFVEACREELTYDTEYVRGNAVFVAEKGGRIIGFYALQRVSDTEAELGAMFIEPEHIGCGFGRALIDHAKRTALKLGIRAIVIQGDPNAVPFYRAAGGVYCGDRVSGSIKGRVLPLFRIEL